MAEWISRAAQLDVFARARNWKSYWWSEIQPFTRGDVLEVGAGIGANIPLIESGHGHWIALEPDANLAERIRTLIARMDDPGRCQVVNGTLDAVASQRFDSILYIDVLEHIEHDVEEVAKAAACLRPEGHLIVLCPAHQRLRSALDDAVGHVRRYNKATLERLTPPSLDLKRLRYLDSVGLIASASNLVLRQGVPSPRQLWLWDRCIVPVSRVLDPLLGHAIGKSVLAIWQKRAGRAQWV